MLQILELFGGIGSPRVALRNMGIPVKSIDYVEKDIKPVRSYNAIFKEDLEYKPQDVRGYNLKPDILIHGSPCQSVSIAGKRQGADEGSNTESSLMWETINIIKQMGIWRPRIVIWENVKGVISKLMIKNFNKYLLEMSKLGYTNSFETLNSMSYGLPQNRDRVFVISILGGIEFNFNKLIKKPMANINNYLETKVEDPFYIVTQPSVLRVIGHKGIKRATIINNYCYTITQRPDRLPAQVIDLKNGYYRFLTEKECWKLQGYNDSDYEAASSVNSRRALYKQAGNSIPVCFFESIFNVLL